MASSPLRSKSRESRQHLLVPPPHEFARPSYVNSSYKQSLLEKENIEQSRSKSPRYYASTAAESRFLADQMRHSQYMSRYALPTYPDPVVIQRVVNSAHQDYFASELTQEVNELRGRQRDYAALQEQFVYLKEQYQNLQFEKNQFESDCLNKISADRNETDMLIRELDVLRADNDNVEDEQFKLIEQIGLTERDVLEANGNIANLRMECSQVDSSNLNLRKDIEFTETRLNEDKDLSNKNYQELNRLREISYNLDKDLEAQSKRIEILRVEIDNNEQRIASISDLLNSKEEAIYRCQGNISEAMKQIQDLKYTLNKLDGELGYFESQNEQHKAAQSQMFKANEYEYMQGKDNNLKMQEMEISLNKLVQDEKSVSYEIDRLKQHSDQMLKDQIDLQAETDALDKHMANLNNQNYCLQKELEEFVAADDQVRRNLDRKNKVQNIRQRVDDVIARSQAEVEMQKRSSYHYAEPSPREMERRELDIIEHAERMNRSRSANAYSPTREELRRQAWGPPEEEMARNQMSFGRDKYEREREARFAMEMGSKENFREDYRQLSPKGSSPLRRSPRSRSFGKNVQFKN